MRGTRGDATGCCCRGPDHGVYWFPGMHKLLLVAGLAVAVLFVPGPARAQFTDPHTYDDAPIGVNQVELIYAYAHSNTSIDTAIIVAGAQLHLNNGTIDYTRYFGLLHRMAWVEGGVPIAGL